MSRKSNRLPRRERTQRFQLSEEHSTLRLWLTVGLILVAAVAFTYGVMNLLGRSSGWTEIRASSSYEESCAGELTFQYELGAAGMNAGMEYREIEPLYTQAAADAYRIFHATETFADLGNLAAVNASPNETVTVDPALYEALELLDRQGGRYLYLAPVYAQYRNLFACLDEADAAAYDPGQSQETADWFREMAAFASDPEAVSLELLGNHQVRLRVSDAYLSYAQENAVSAFIDLYWMTNAFAVDYIAGVLLENGYTYGNISSYDGFVRNLDDRGTGYGFNLYDRVGNALYSVGRMDYSGAMSIVYLRDYPMGELDVLHYRERSDGRTVTAYVDPADGVSRAAASQLVAYSAEESCAQVLMSVLDLYVADSLEEDALLALPSQGVELILCRDYTVLHTQEDLLVTGLYDSQGVRYTTQAWR